jgi:hypothetical protein
MKIASCVYLKADMLLYPEPENGVSQSWRPYGASMVISQRKRENACVPDQMPDLEEGQHFDKHPNNL